MACICQPLSSFFKAFSAVFLVNEQQRLVPITIYFWSLFLCIPFSFHLVRRTRSCINESSSWWNFLLEKKKHLFELSFSAHRLTFFNVFNCHRSYSQSIHYTKLTQNENFSREICNLRNSQEFIKICLFFLRKDTKIAHKEIIPN